MAFSTTQSEVLVQPGVLSVRTTLADTAGNSLPMQLADADNVTFQFAVSGTAGTITVQCSNDGVTFFGLPTAVTAVAAGVASLVQANQGFRHYRFNLAGGDATTSWTITTVAHLSGRQGG